MVEFEMTLSRAEFLRLLPAAVGGDGFTREELAGTTVLTHRGQGRSWRISLAPLPPLLLGPIPLARFRVQLACAGQPQEAFVERFLRHYQRGGG